MGTTTSGSLKLNVDASFTSANHAATLGVWWYVMGKVMVSGVSKMHGVFDAMHAEAMAMVFGLEVAWERGFVHLMVESDASLVAKEVNCAGPSCWAGGYLIDQVRHLSTMFDACSFSFINRGQMDLLMLCPSIQLLGRTL